MSYTNESNEQQSNGGQAASAPRLPDGRYRARAVGHAWGTSANGNEQLGVDFEILTEGYEGKRIAWYTVFSDELKGNQKKTSTQTAIETLRVCGWKGDDLADLSGIDANEVELAIEAEEFEGKLRSKVQYVNRIGGVAFKNPMNAEQIKAFAAKMRDKVAAITARMPSVASAPPSSQQRPPATRPPATRQANGNGGRQEEPPPGRFPDDLPF